MTFGGEKAKIQRALVGRLEFVCGVYEFSIVRCEGWIEFSFEESREGES